MEKETVAVIIPVYKVPDAFELVSISALNATLKRYRKIIITNRSLSPRAYDGIDYHSVEFFNEHYFSGIPGYNKLMLSSELYERFTHYKYILIYQLDAFVFSDQLASWCKSGYDYIGAPWLNSPAKVRAFKKYPFYKNWTPLLKKGSDFIVGNGGLSLRKVSSFIRLLKNHQQEACNFTVNEDMFWSWKAQRLNPFFKVAPPRKALAFSFETDPALALQLNNGELPFGCHGWDKRYDFWEKYIPLDENKD